jgi:cation:H+ antiporter
MELPLNIFLLLCGITFLVWGANKFVDHSSSIAKHLGISDLVIGLTLVAFGTSAPEIFVGISGVINGNEDIAFGNVIGSNIANIGLIFGVTCFYFNAPSKTQLLNFIPFSLSIILLGFSLRDGTISFSESVGFITLLIFFMYVLLQKRKSPDDEEPFKASNINMSMSMSMSMSIILALIGLIALFMGSGITIHYAEKTAILFGVPQIIIGLTIIALGTSLPELAAAVVALGKGKHQMVIGNIIGSNVLNLVFVIPIIGFFGSINISPVVMERDFYILSAMSIFFIILAIVLTKMEFRKSIFSVSGIFLISSYMLYLSVLSGII